MSENVPAQGTLDRARPSVMLYSHDGFGLGHLRRTVRLGQIIRKVVPEASVLIVTSSPAAGRPLIPDELEYIKLPSVTKTGAERYHPHYDTTLESCISLRSALLLTAVQEIQPDLLLVDHRPLGLKREVLPALEWIKSAAPHIHTVVGLRDVLDEPSTVMRDWRENGIYEALDYLYETILVYGERSVLDITREYAMPGPIARKARFTGYLGAIAPQRTREEVRASLGLTSGRLVVVHAGGGGDGKDLIDTYLDTFHLLPGDIHSLVVTGPLMSRDDRERFKKEATDGRITLVEYQHDLASAIAAADVSVSMGGYNTVCEVLSAGVPALVVPRIFPRQEQYIRAQRLAERGLLDMLLPTSLTPVALAAGVVKALADPPTRHAPVNLNGAERAAQLLAPFIANAHAPYAAVRSG